MRKKTALQTPGNRKASPKQTKGLVAKGQKPRQSAQETCVLDNRSHRTPRGLPTFAGGHGACPSERRDRRWMARRARSDSECAAGPPLTELDPQREGDRSCPGTSLFPCSADVITFVITS